MRAATLIRERVGSARKLTPHTVPPLTDPLIGRVLAGRFELVSFVAAGGMGRVYEAIQRPLNRPCAVKILDLRVDYQERARERFHVEACVSARLMHPNTVRIFDYGREDDDLYFLVMELLVGESLRSVIGREGALPPHRAIAILRQVCSALAEAHRGGLVHRDLKPSRLPALTCPATCPKHIAQLARKAAADLSCNPPKAKPPSLSRSEARLC